MAKQVKMVELTHQWVGKAVVKDENGYNEIELGVVTTDKKLKETGAKELFKETGKVPENAITILVEKLDDVKIVYVADSEEFKKIAKVQDIQEESINE